MTPAPGPFSPPLGDGGTSSSVGTASTTAGLTGDASASQHGISNSRPTMPERTVSSSAVNIPKTCACCGGLLESSQSDPPVRQLAHATASLATAPSPSSIAFATHPPSASVTTAPTLNAASLPSSITTVLGDTLAATEALQAATEQQHDRPQLCLACLSRGDEEEAVRESTTIVSNTSTDNDGDSTMAAYDVTLAATDAGVQRIATAASASTDALGSGSPQTPERRSMHPWRRQAPWANLRRPSQETPTHRMDDDRPPLTISVGNMGAGGDAVTQLYAPPEDDPEFPPLARSPSANSPVGTATSPRLPLSPTRSRAVQTAGAGTPPALGRQASFSRSQNGALANAPSTTAGPIVNVPTVRGRTRAGSSSGSLPPPTASTVSVRGRRLSGTRRLSRSSSSQGPTSVSFADVGESVSTSTLLDESRRAEAIEEDPFGPLSMTRPRLSTLSPKELRKNQTGKEQDLVADVYRKPFVHHEFLTSSSDKHEESREDDGGVEARETLQKQLLVWFNCRRPDPRVDISRIRFTSAGRGCLFPGATFRGTQKSGRMSYDVMVQIVNVDLNASHLGGYLNIRGLTDDWPELTTYFDAEIIGQRYGFITGKWGATEADDMKHWGRFTPFRPIRSSLTRPGLRFNHLNKPYVFMRWKERFLVPDHRVRDINGASFAGFYYVCVELGDDADAPSQSLTSPASPVSSPGAAPPPVVRGRHGGDAMDMDTGGFGHSESASYADPASGGFFGGNTDALSATSGRMSGFYFHEHSEPYQQLTLRHVSEASSTTFEMR